MLQSAHEDDSTEPEQWTTQHMKKLMFDCENVESTFITVGTDEEKQRCNDKELGKNCDISSSAEQDSKA